MSIEKGKISGSQLTFLATGLIQGSILPIAYIADIAKHDIWLVVIAGFVVTVPFAFIYAWLAQRFRGMNLIEIHDAVYGKYIGKAVSILYFFYFLMALSSNIRTLADFYGTFLMPETPLNFFLVVFTLGCAYAIRKGIEVLARISHLFVAVIFLIILSTILLVIPNMDFTNFLPFFELPVRKFIQGTHIIAAIPFGEIFIFLTVMSALNGAGHIVKNTLLGLLLGAVSLLLVSIRNTAVLGSTEAILTSPPFQSVRIINIGNVFTRMDILVGIILTITMFIKCSLFYYATMTSLGQILKLKFYIPLILPVGGIAVILAAINWESSAMLVKLSHNTAPIFVTPILFIFPPLSLLIAKIRNISKKGGCEKE